MAFILIKKFFTDLSKICAELVENQGFINVFFNQIQLQSLSFHVDVGVSPKIVINWIHQNINL